MIYRNELREYLLAKMRKATEQMTARELAVKLCEVEGKDWQDRRLYRRGPKGRVRFAEDARYKDRGRRAHPGRSSLASVIAKHLGATVALLSDSKILIEGALAILGVASIAWIAVGNRKLWTQHDADFGRGDNNEVFRAMHSGGGFTGVDGCAGDGGPCGGGDGGGCH